MLILWLIALCIISSWQHTGILAYYVNFQPTDYSIPRFETTIPFEEGLKLVKKWSALDVSPNISTRTAFVVDTLENEQGIKAAQYLKHRFYPSSKRVSAACAAGHVTVNGKKIFASRILKNGDEVEVYTPAPPVLSEDEEEEKAIAEAAAMEDHTRRLLNFTNSFLDPSYSQSPLYTVYEDDHLAVVFKPSGVHSLQWLGTMKKRLFAMDDILPLILTPPPIFPPPSSPLNMGRYGEHSSTNSHGDATVTADTDREKLHQINGLCDSGPTRFLARPLPCHRLDARVPGVLLVAKSSVALAHLNKQFETRKVKKEYRAILVGNITQAVEDLVGVPTTRGVNSSRSDLYMHMNSDGITSSTTTPTSSSADASIINVNTTTTTTTDDDSSSSISALPPLVWIDLPVGSRAALSQLHVLDVTPCNVYGALSRVALWPQSGRRHQLRQHCAALGCPIVGDDLYHAAAFVPRQQRLATIQACSGEQQDKEQDKEQDNQQEQPVPVGAASGAEAAPSRGAVTATCTPDSSIPLSSAGLRHGKDVLQQDGALSVTVNPALFALEHNTDEVISASFQNHRLDGRSAVWPPKVRKGVGMFLMAKSIAFTHPFPTTAATTAAAVSSDNTGVQNMSSKNMTAPCVYVGYEDGTTDEEGGGGEGGRQRRQRDMESTTLGISGIGTYTPSLIVKVAVPELPKYRKIIDKASKGAAWKASNYLK